MTNEIGDDTATGTRGRTGVKIALATFALALAGAGVYAVAGGGSPEANATGSKTSTVKAEKSDKDGDTVTAKPSASPTPKPSKAPELPSAKNMTNGEKRAALIAYLNKGDFPLTDDSSPATAAKGACDLLDGGTDRDKLVSDLSHEAEVSKKLGEYFVIGATHFYCSKHSVS